MIVPQAKAGRKEDKRQAEIGRTVAELKRAFPQGVYGRATELGKVPQRR